jgi:hypothetical protein
LIVVIVTAAGVVHEDAFAVLTVRPDGEHDDTCPEHLTDKDLDDLKLTSVAKVIAMSTPRE